MVVELLVVFLVYGALTTCRKLRHNPRYVLDVVASLSCQPPLRCLVTRGRPNFAILQKICHMDVAYSRASFGTKLGHFLRRHGCRSIKVPSRRGRLGLCHPLYFSKNCLQSSDYNRRKIMVCKSQHNN